MSDESSKTKDIVEAVTELTKQVPIYQDAIQPAAKELGKGLEVVAKAVNAALVPIEGLVWGIEKIREFVHSRVSEKLKDVPPDRIQAPDPHVAGPTLEALRYSGHHDELSEMFANLLATSMDRETAINAHPSFVDIIKELTPDEAKILTILATRDSVPAVNIKMTLAKAGGYILTHRNITTLGVEASCQHPQLTSNYLGNLDRLGLIDIPFGVRIKDDKAYETLLEHPQIKEIIKSQTHEGSTTCEAEKRKVEVTDYGKQFIRACVIGKGIQTKG
ncbi:DUF4393 domain-containing protein [Akkermansiaceae bacterium]|nr:DUF4393 domain-containing protein [Akkermansiaceae bacterium]